MKAQLLDDTALVLGAQGGDRQAFAALYDRYFETVYDFLLRTHLSPEDAADSTQEAFLKAMGAIASLTEPAKFRSWMFTIARNAAVSRMRSTKTALSLDIPARDAAATPLADLLPDTDIASLPEAAAERASAARAVWAVAAGLDRRQYMVLDLSVRQGLEADELAEVMGITRNNAYVMVNRTKKAFSESAADYVDFTTGRRDCPRLREALEEAAQTVFSPEARVVIDRHVQRCQRCGERRKRLPLPLALFGGFALAAPPEGLKRQVAAHLGLEPATVPAPGPSATRPRPRRRRGGIALVAGAGLLLLIGGGIVGGLWGTSDAGGEFAGSPDSSATTSSTIVRAAGAGATSTATAAAGAIGATPSPRATAAQTATLTPEPNLVSPPNAGTPGSTPSPAAAAPAGPTPTSSLGPPVRPTPEASVGEPSPEPSATETPKLLPTAAATPTQSPSATTPIPQATPSPTLSPKPSPTPSPTATPTPVPVPALSVDKVVACWLKTGGLLVGVGVGNLGNESLVGYVTMSSDYADLAFSGSSGQAIVGQKLKQGDYVLFVSVKTATRYAEKTLSSGLAAC